MIDPKPGDEGRTVVYVPERGVPEVGTLSSWHDGVAFARYTSGSTAAGANFGDLVWYSDYRGPWVDRRSGEARYHTPGGVR